jgi:amino-acid N-acetyltransferase
MSHENFNNIILDITLLQSMGIKLVLVHGIDYEKNERLKKLKDDQNQDISNVIIDHSSMSLIKDLVGSTKISIEAMLSSGAASSVMCRKKMKVVSGNFITAKPAGIKGGIDLQYTGEIRRIDSSSILKQLENDAIVLLSPIGYSPSGEVFNLNYIDLAVKSAIGLDVDKLIIFDKNEGLRGLDGKLLKTLSINEAQEYLNDPQIDHNQKQALKACSEACKKNVRRSHIVSYISNGALLEELFTRDGNGTLVLKNSVGLVRQATIDDIGGLLKLIEPQEKNGALVKRSRELLELEITRFTVLEHTEGPIISCCALYPHDGSQSAEIACIVTHPEFIDQGHARQLLEVIEKKAYAMKINRLFALTIKASHWFIENGFVQSSIDDLPIERQSLYNFQRNSKVFCKRL